MPATVTLSKPLQTHQGDVTELTLRDITARDMVEMKLAPVRVQTDAEGIGAARIVSTKYDVRYDTAMGYLTRLTGVDEVLLGALSARDFDKCVTKLQELWAASGE